MAEKTLRKTRKTTTPKKAAKPQWRRPMKITIDGEFIEGGRKVMVADLEKAAAAAGAAARASLEGRAQPYELSRLEVAIEYNYLMTHKQFDA